VGGIGGGSLKEQPFFVALFESIVTHGKVEEEGQRRRESGGLKNSTTDQKKVTDAVGTRC
jgi:hypothetical protein